MLVATAFVSFCLLLPSDLRFERFITGTHAQRKQTCINRAADRRFGCASSLRMQCGGVGWTGGLLSLRWQTDEGRASDAQSLHACMIKSASTALKGGAEYSVNAALSAVLRFVACRLLPPSPHWLRCFVASLSIPFHAHSSHHRVSI